MLALPGAARAQMDEVARALRIDPVYGDPDAQLAEQVKEDTLRDKIVGERAAPMFIAVLPASATEQSAGRTLLDLRRQVGERGTYALAVGNELRTLSDYYDGAPRAGDEARAKHPDDLQ